MVRFSSIIIVYFVIGAVMWGGGAITWDEAGIGTYIIEDGADGEIDNSVIGHMQNLGGPIGNVVGTVGGGLLATWNFMSRLIGFAFWPITALRIAGAPSEAVVLGGGSLVIAFIASFIRTIRGSA